MTHSLHTRRSMFAEARMLRFAGAGPEAGGAPEVAPPPVEAKAEAPDPRSTFRKAQERIKVHGEKLKALQAKLKPLQTLQTKHEAGDALKADELEKHGVTDEDGDGTLKSELDAKVKELEGTLQPHQAALDTANAESTDALKAIEGTGPGGKLDAAFMRVDSVMKDPNASLGEKISAVIMAFAEMQNVLKGITAPAGAPGGKNGSPETSPSSPQGKKESVRAMMKDGGFAKIDDLRDDREDKVTALMGQKAAVETAVTASKTNLSNAQTGLTNANAALAGDKENPDKQKAARDAQADVTTSEAAVKAAEQNLATLNADIAKAEAELKTVKSVEEDGEKSVDDFDQQKEIIEAKLKALKELPGIDEDKAAAIEDLIDALDWEDADLADNGIDVTLKIDGAHMPRFLEKMTKAGLDPKALKIGAGGVIDDPVAFQAGMDQFIAKATVTATKPKAEEAK